MSRFRIVPLIAIAAVMLSCSAKSYPRVAKPAGREGDDPYFQFVRSGLLAMGGELQRSTAELQKLTRKHPEMAYFHFLLAQGYGSEKRFAEAVESCREAVRLAPDLVEARLYLGRLYASQEMHAEAARAFSDVARDFPKQEDAYTLLASEYVAAREYGRAVEALKQLLAINPDSVVAYFFLGRIHEDHLGRPDEAQRMYREALSIEPGNLSVQTSVAELHAKRKQYRAALAKFGEILHQVQDDVGVALRIALIHYELKEYDKAISVFEDILERNPDADKIRFYLGVLYEGAKEPRRAIAELMKVPANSTYFKDARLHIASMHRAAGEIADAIEALSDAIKLKEQIPEFYEYLAAVHEERGDYSLAMEVLIAGHDAVPGDEKVAFLLGILCEKAKERDRAIAAMRDVLKINPKNASAMNYIGYAYAERGENLEEALELIQRALVLKPGDGYITDSLGWVYFKMGDLDRSLKHLLRAASTVRDEPTILYHLAEVLLARGETKPALKHYEQALAAGSRRPDMDEEEMERIRARIEELRTR